MGAIIPGIRVTITCSGMFYPGPPKPTADDMFWDEYNKIVEEIANGKKEKSKKEIVN